MIIGSPPTPPDVSNDPGSPTVENVDIEALNNANNLAAQLPVQESTKQGNQNKLIYFTIYRVSQKTYSCFDRV